MKKNIQRSELLIILNAINGVKDLQGVRFAYGIAKNRDRIVEEVKTLQSTIAPSKEFVEFNAQRIALCEKYCDRDKSGKAIILNDSYVGLDDNSDFQQELEKLRDENKEVVEAQERLAEEYKSMLSEEIEFEFFEIPLDMVPENITVEQMDGIMILISEGG